MYVYQFYNFEKEYHKQNSKRVLKIDASFGTLHFALRILKKINTSFSKLQMTIFIYLYKQLKLNSYIHITLY